MNKSIILQDEILKRTCKELYNAGLNFFKIASLLELSTNKVRDIFKQLNITEPYPQNVENERLINEILYDVGMPIAQDTIIAIEKDRFKQYAELEANCLSLMCKMVKYYDKIPEGDPKMDAFKAQLVSSFIKITHQAYEGVLKDYKAETKTENKIEVKIIEAI